MKKTVSQGIVFIVSFFLIGLVFAKGSFCDYYDPKITHMDAINDDSQYGGLPKRLTSQEYKKLAKPVDDYCPPCTLKDQALCQQRPCQRYNLIEGSIYDGIQAETDPWMQMANEEALKSVQNGGGPFGAVIVQIDDASGKVIRYWKNHNHVAEWNDPTAHAEVTVIRAAARQLGVLNLGRINKKEAKLPQPGEWSHCVMYSSAESCPMCMAATYWAGIKEGAFSATRYDAAVNGVDFSDEMIYQEFSKPYKKRQRMRVVHANSNNGLDAFNYYKRNEVPRYGSDK